MRWLFCLYAALFLAAAAQAQVATPVFDREDEWTNPTAFWVVVSCTTPGATIHYTKNGQTPTQSAPSFVASGSVQIPQNLTLKARAWSGGTASAVASADYHVSGMVSAGTGHIVALSFDGKVYAWGEQTSGRLGNGLLTSGTVKIPAELKKTGSFAFTDAAQVAAGENHSLLLDASGTVWATGANTVGQLGTGTSGTTTNLALAVGLSSGTSGFRVAQVEAGSEFSLALTTVATGSGKVLSWGEGAQGRLGNNSTNDRSSPGFVLKAASGNPPLDNIIEIAAGKNFGAALHSDGTLYTWGV